jgi:signal recognition particle receptor subunit beta
MSFVNFGKREINFKIVYYGPPLCGKTTNLEHLHAVIPDDARGPMTMLSTRQDRTLFFDFLPLQSKAIKGFISKFQLYTVPGQTIYNQTRRLVLNSVDGIVFVADSQWEEMENNVESFRNLQENLQSYGLTLRDVCYVLQFNKRDLPNVAPYHYIDFLLNQQETKARSFEAVATEGVGVHETLNMVSKLVMAKFIEDHNMPVNEEFNADQMAVREA